MKAMRQGNVRAASVAPAASSFAGGSMASSIGSAITVPNPFRKVRRGICQVLFMTMFYDRITDEITLQTLQTQAANCSVAGRRGEFKNCSRRRKEADFGAKNTSASLPQRLRVLRRFVNSPRSGKKNCFCALDQELSGWQSARARMLPKLTKTNCTTTA